MSSQYTPYGSLVYSGDSGSPSGYRSDITLAPQAKQTLDQQMQLSNQLGDVAQAQMPHVQNTYSRPMDISSVNDVADRAYGALTSRMDPQWNRREEQLRTQLANQGIGLGSEAYTNAMGDFNTGRNDAYQQANLAAIQTMPQTFQMANSVYNQPLNTLNALRTGAQVQNPQFTQTPGANYMGAAQAQGAWDSNVYNQKVAQQNAMMQGLFGLGSAGVGAYGMMNAAPMIAMSDRRLKSNVVRIGTHRLGIGLYEYDIGDRREVGVMADEVERVLPEAVVDVGGFKAVNYGML